MQLIDTHCHLYSKEFDRDLEEVFQRAEKEGVGRFYLPAIDSHCQEALLALEARHPGKCFGMTGLHPCHVKEDHAAELQFVAAELARRSWVALGEIGLDFYWDRTLRRLNTRLFTGRSSWPCSMTSLSSSIAGSR